MDTFHVVHLRIQNSENMKCSLEHYSKCTKAVLQLRKSLNCRLPTHRLVVSQLRTCWLAIRYSLARILVILKTMS